MGEVGKVGSATIAEVAKHAGVSPSTVSYVLTGNRRISDETRARVRRAIKELNYRPHAGARSLRAGKTDVVALVVPLYDWSLEHVLMPFVYGVVEAAHRQGWNVMLVTSAADGSEIERVVGSKMVDGVVLMEIRADDKRLKIVEQLGVPAAALGMPCQATRVPFVDFDFEGAGRLCVRSLASHGHEHVGFLASPPGTFDNNLGYARRMWDGVVSGAREAGLAFHGFPMEGTKDAVERGLDRLFDEEPRLSALIVFNEGALESLIQALRERGKDVPSDISLIAVASGPSVRHVVPPVTYVEVPSVAMGRAAVELLAGARQSGLLPLHLITGATLGPPPRGGSSTWSPQSKGHCVD